MDKDERRRLIDAEVAAAEKVDQLPSSVSVNAKRWSGGWELHIEGEGITQVTEFSDAVAQVRSYLSMKYDLRADHIDVVILGVPNESAEGC